MEKNRFLSIVFLLCMVIGMQAQSMRDVWLSMPDSALPYLNKEMQREMIDLADRKSKAGVKNLLNGQSAIDSITDRYLSVSISDSYRIQMRLLPYSKGDSILCVVRTYLAPEPESVLRFYSRSWVELPMSHCFEDGQSYEEIAQSLIVRPDTMPESQFLELKRMIDPMMIAASLSPESNSIVISLSLPLLSAEEKKQINTIILQRKLNWNGTFFN